MGRGVFLLLFRMFILKTQLYQLLFSVFPLCLGANPNKTIKAVRLGLMEDPEDC